MPVPTAKKIIDVLKSLLPIMAGLALLFLIDPSAHAAQGDFQPDREGISRETNYYGINYNEFNLFTDNYVLCYERFWTDVDPDTVNPKNPEEVAAYCNQNYQDERDFITAKNLSSSDDRYYHTLNTIKKDNTVRVMIYWHNNGQQTSDNRYTAKDVKADMNYSDPKSLQARIYCSNCQTTNIYDYATLQFSGDYDLEYISGSTYLITNNTVVGYLKDSDSRLTFNNENKTIRFTDGSVPGCYDYVRYIYFDFKVKEKAPAECESLLLTPETIDIADILAQSGKEQMTITTDPAKFAGPYDWTASSGGKLTNSCNVTTYSTNTTDEKMTFCGDNVGEKVSVKNRAFTSCTDSTTITDYCGNGYTYTASGEDCDNGTANTDTPCTPTYGNECSYCKKNCDKITVKGGYCGDKKVDTGYEDCDDGNTTNGDGCSSTCKKEPPPVECESLQFLNTEVIANTTTTLSVNIEPDSYVPDINWVATENGTFNNQNPYNSGSQTSVTFKNGSIDEYILAYDTDSSSTCSDYLQVIGCKSVTVTPSSFNLVPGQTQLLTLTPNPTSWNKSFQWTSTDTTATFNGQSSGYTSNDYTVNYIGNISASITITDMYGNCTTSALSIAPYCGNGTIESGEECDDGTGNTDTPCTPAYNSECSYCTKTCDKVTVKGGYCGNGIVETGEQCDDGNTSNSDQCTTSCQPTYCGDKIIQNPNGNGQSEDCDDGNTTNGDGCSSACKKEASPAECDSLQFLNTEVIANTTTTLSVNIEPDSYVPDINWVATENGTFNNQNPYNSSSTTSVTFKNGAIDEYILAYDTDSSSTCNDYLQVIGCKSVTVTPSSFNLVPGQTQLLTLTPNPTSWNKSFQWTSTDTTATFNGQSSGYTSNDYTVNYIGNVSASITITDMYGNCTTSALTIAPYCGNSTIESGEECDDGTGNTDTPCAPTYNSECSYCKKNCDKVTVKGGYCGDKKVDTGYEACDDGNTVDTDSCTNTCTIPTVAPFCGNGIVETGEQCDDGNTVDTDSCTNTCTTPTVTPFCGNGIVETGEQCDDGNTVDTDSCKNNCTIPTGGPITCIGLTANPSSLSAGQASDILITPQPENFTGTFIWTASRGLLQNLSEPSSTPASTINTDENDVVHYDGNSASGDTISIQEQGNQCATSMPITGGGGGPSCGNGVIESGEQCEPPNTSSCDANCQIPGGGEPGGTNCNIKLKNDKNVYLYDDGTQYPADVSLTESPLRFYIEEINSGKPYQLKTVNSQGTLIGSFTSYSGTDWDDTDIYRPNENPMDDSYQTHYSFSIDLNQIDSDTRLTVDSENQSCPAQLRFTKGTGPGGGESPGGEACTSIILSVDTLNFGLLNIEDENGGGLPVIVEIITDPQSFADAFTWTVTPSDLPITFNGFPPPYSSGDKTVAIDLAEGKTVADVKDGIISVTSESEPTCSGALDVIPAISGGDGIDSLVKKSFCIVEGTTIGQDGDPATYNMFYYFEPEGNDATVTFQDTFGKNNGKIPGEINGTPSSTDHIEFTEMQTPILIKGAGGNANIALCTASPTSLCYDGDLSSASGLTLKNINDVSIDHQNDYIQLTFTGIIHSSTDLNCESAASSLELFRNQLTSQAYDASGTATSSHDSYASIWASCPYLLTRNMGDVFFEEPFDWGADTMAVSNVKNATGLVFKQYESEPTASCQTGGANIIQRFSSYLCEFSTFVASLWKSEESSGGAAVIFETEQEEPITNRIGKNIAKVTRYFKKNESAGTSATLNSLNISALDGSTIFSEKPDSTQKIYEYHGDLTIQGIGGEKMSIDGNEARTILIYGNLTINSNITYSTAGSGTLYKNIPSIAFVVREDTTRADSTGNIKIAQGVTYISGIFYAENSLESASGDSNNMLTIQGSVYGDIEPLFRTRKKVGNPEKDEGSIVIRYDERILLNTPPGLKDILKSDWEEVAR